MHIYNKPSIVLPVHSIPMRFQSSSTRLPRTIYIVVFILIVGVFVTLINVFELRALQNEHYQMKHGMTSQHSDPHPNMQQSEFRTPVFWVKANNPDSGYLTHVYNVLDRLGYDRINEEKQGDWDVLWHHDYPFLDPKMKKTIDTLAPGQKVNHIPGSGFYTSKVNLATSNISGIPPAFSLPAEKLQFLSFARAHPEKFWVQKSNNHRGVVIKQVNELHLDQDDSFIQEYIANPLLIDGRKFDIGIYTMIVSGSPLRVYVYEADALLRFCPQNYAPFDPRITDKYVVSDEYTPTWMMPSLKGYYTDMQLTFKESLNAYLRSRGQDPAVIWHRMYGVIRDVLLDKQLLMNSFISKYKQPWNFFELSRFDFVLDEELNVFLMEANMSPNLSSGHFLQNKYLYEQVLFNLFSVVGVAGMALHSGNDFTDKSSDWTQMRAPDKHLMVYPELCMAEECRACSIIKCQLCNHCMTPSTLSIIRRAYDEHINRIGTRRIIPQPFQNQLEARNYELFQNRLQDAFTDNDKLITWWLRGKCLQDVTWCS